LFRRFRLRHRLGRLNGFRLPKQFSPALRGSTLRVLDAEDVSNIAAPSLCQRMDHGFFDNVQGQFAAPRTDDILAKLDFVSGENLDALPSPRNGHIPLLVVGCGLHGGIGEQDVIYGLALGGVGSDRIRPAFVSGMALSLTQIRRGSSLARQISRLASETS